MATMSSPLPSGPRPFSRRTLLGVSAAGLAALATGCTSSDADEREKVTGRQADQLGAQVAVQEAVASAFVAAGAADPALAAEVADLAAQADEQLTRLRRAAPDASASASPPPAAAPPAPETRAWLRGQVAAAAVSHATACLDQSGARAALLGSIAAGLAGQDVRLA
jgi:hypothetical protein